MTCSLTARSQSMYSHIKLLYILWTAHLSIRLLVTITDCLIVSETVTAFSLSGL